MGKSKSHQGCQSSDYRNAFQNWILLAFDKGLSIYIFFNRFYMTDTFSSKVLKRRPPYLSESLSFMDKSEVCSDIIWALLGFFLWSYNTLVSLQVEKMNGNIRSPCLKLFYASGLHNQPGQKILLFMMVSSKHYYQQALKKWIKRLWNRLALTDVESKLFYQTRQ